MKQEEGYQPTPEEIEKAESMMSRKEEAFSAARERYYGERLKIAEKMGVSPEALKNISLDLKEVKFPGKDFYSVVMSGKVDGHDVFLRRAEGSDEMIVGSIDHKKIRQQDARALWDKYHYLALSFDTEQKNLLAMSEEDWEGIEEGEEAQKLLKDIL